MALESATYINQLVSSNPTLADPKGQGDDHLRMIKLVLKNTFPNLTGSVTLTQEQVNAVADTTLFFKPGMIVIWGGSLANIPTGWLLCNGVGTISTGSIVPNLLDKFVFGAGGSTGPGGVGGSFSHTHTVSVSGVGLTVDQLPPHNHGSLTGSFIVGGAGNGTTVGGGNLGSINVTGTTGSGATHNHPAFASTVDHLPPWFALAYIIKN